MIPFSLFVGAVSILIFALIERLLPQRIGPTPRFLLSFALALAAIALCCTLFALCCW